MDLREQILDFDKRARQAARALAKLESEQKNAALRAMADEVVASAAGILAANEKDLAHAPANALPGAMIDRLMLNEGRLAKMAEGIRQVATLPDPVGEVLRAWTQPNGIEITKCAFRSASSASFSNPGLTSPATLPSSARKRATR